MPNRFKIMARNGWRARADRSAAIALTMITNPSTIASMDSMILLPSSTLRRADILTKTVAIPGLHSRNEAVYYDPQTGVKLNDNLVDYKWFSMNDIQGPMEQVIVETGMGYGPYGICGCSEAVGATMATCTSDAIYNAIGKRITSFPTTPDKVLKALGKA